jgi:hypothetical protein
MLRLSHTAHPAHELCAPSLLLKPAPLLRVPLELLLRQSRIQSAHQLHRALHQARQCEQLLRGLDRIIQAGKLRQVFAWRKNPQLRLPSTLHPLGATPQTLPGQSRDDGVQVARQKPLPQRGTATLHQRCVRARPLWRRRTLRQSIQPALPVRICPRQARVRSPRINAPQGEHRVEQRWNLIEQVSQRSGTPLLV